MGVLVILALFVGALICFKITVHMRKEHENCGGCRCGCDCKHVCANCKFAKKFGRGKSKIRVCVIDKEVMEIIKMAESDTCPNWKHK